MHLIHFQLYLYEKLLQVLLPQHLLLDWLIGSLIESGSSVQTCDKFALWTALAISMLISTKSAFWPVEGRVTWPSCVRRWRSINCSNWLLCSAHDELQLLIVINCTKWLLCSAHVNFNCWLLCSEALQMLIALVKVRSLTRKRSSLIFSSQTPRTKRSHRILSGVISSWAQFFAITHSLVTYALMPSPGSCLQLKGFVQKGHISVSDQFSIFAGSS